MPANIAETVFTVFCLFLAFMLAASIEAFITTHMTRLQLLSSQQSTQLAKLKRYLVDHGISRTLALRVQRNAQHALMMHERNMSETSVEVLKLVSEPLRVELHFEVHSVTLMLHPFFMKYNDVNPMGLRRVCHTAVLCLSLSSGDVLFSDHEDSRRRTLFLIHGRLMYEQENSEPCFVVSDQWLCEAPLWTTWFHCGNCRAFAESQLLSLDTTTFQTICSTFPSEQPVAYGTLFVEWLNSTLEHSDVGKPSMALDDMILEAFPEDKDSEEDSDEDEDGKHVHKRRSSLSSWIEGNKHVSPMHRHCPRLAKLLFHKGKRGSHRNSRDSNHSGGGKASTHSHHSHHSDHSKRHSNPVLHQMNTVIAKMKQRSSTEASAILPVER